jgi:hypothetical protein
MHARALSLCSATCKCYVAFIKFITRSVADLCEVCCTKNAYLQKFSKFWWFCIDYRSRENEIYNFVCRTGWKLGGRLQQLNILSSVLLSCHTPEFDSLKVIHQTHAGHFCLVLCLKDGVCAASCHVIRWVRNLLRWVHWMETLLKIRVCFYGHFLPFNS